MSPKRPQESSHKKEEAGRATQAAKRQGRALAQARARAGKTA